MRTINIDVEMTDKQYLKFESALERAYKRNVEDKETAYFAAECVKARIDVDDVLSKLTETLIEMGK